MITIGTVGEEQQQNHLAYAQSGHAAGSTGKGGNTANQGISQSQ